jgi:hypothetical protein
LGDDLSRRGWALDQPPPRRNETVCSIVTSAHDGRSAHANALTLGVALPPANRPVSEFATHPNI